jgi:hypothetical protein
MRFTTSTPVSTFVSTALSRILHVEAQIPKALSATRRARDSMYLNIALLLSSVLLLCGYINPLAPDFFFFFFSTFYI